MFVDVYQSGADLTVTHLTERFGTPSTRERTTAATVIARITDDRLKRLTASLAPDKAVDWVTWESSCRGRVRQSFTGIFDPGTGSILEVEGQRLYSTWRAM